MLLDSGIISWCRKALEDGEYQPVDITISLLVLDSKDESATSSKPLQSWNVVHAYPVKWNVADFNAEEKQSLGGNTRAHL